MAPVMGAFLRGGILLKFTIKLRSKRRNSKGAITYKSFEVEAETKEEAVEKITSSDEMIGFKLWEVHQEFPKELLKKVEYAEGSDVQKIAVFCNRCGGVAYYFGESPQTNVICPICGKTLIERSLYKIRNQ